jgi:hypothetical protein
MTEQESSGSKTLSVEELRSELLYAGVLLENEQHKCCSTCKSLKFVAPKMFKCMKQNMTINRRVASACKLHCIAWEHKGDGTTRKPGEPERK